jgi:hypothetical protein
MEIENSAEMPDLSMFGCRKDVKRFVFEGRVKCRTLRGVPLFDTENENPRLPRTVLGGFDGVSSSL